MSSLLGGVGKIFTSIGSGLGATLGSAVRAVGANVFTAGAATGSSIAGGGLSSLFSGAGGVLSNMFNGATSILGGAATSAAGTTGATGATSTTGLFSGPWGQNQDIAAAGLGGGLFPAATPTGFAPTGASAATGAGCGLLSGIGGLLNNPTIASAMEGYGEYSKIGAESEARQAENKQVIDEKQRAEAQIRANYEVPSSAYAGGGGYVPDPTPRVKPAKKWAYVDGKGVVQV